MNGKPSGQRGTALVIALMLLVILTLVAIAGTNTTVAELRMAGGRQSSITAFQLAESAVAAALGCELAPLVTGSVDMLTEADCGTTVTVDATGDYEFDIRRDSSGDGSVLPEGISLGGELQTLHFVVEARAEAGRGARAEVTQGYYMIGPRD